MILLPLQVPSGNLGMASSTHSHLLIITTSLQHVWFSHSAPKPLQPATFLLWSPSAPPSCPVSPPLIPAMMWLPVCSQQTSLCLPLQATCCFSSCPFRLTLNTTWGLWNLAMFFTSPLHQLNTWHQLWSPLWSSLTRNTADSKEFF